MATDGPLGKIYVIGCGDNGPVKVGISCDVSKRVATLQCGNPARLKIFFEQAVSDPGFVESLCHLKLSSMVASAGNEWFDVAPWVAVSVVKQFLEKLS